MSNYTNPQNAPKLFVTALRYALDKFGDELDRSGVPIIEHSLRVAFRSRDLYVKIGGVLHDVLEDTDATIGDLERIGIPDEVIKAVVAVTRVHGETYAAFIERIVKAGKLAIRIKLNDLDDNLARIHELPEGEGMRRRYEKARERLLAVWDYER